MLKRRSRWTNEEVDKLISMLEEYSNPYIANYFKTTVSSITNVMNRRGIKRSLRAIDKLRKITNKKTSIRSSKLTGSRNPNWKGGISKNYYHYKKLQIERYPERIKARVAVNSAVRSGKLKRGKCEICGNENVQAHHDDYSKSLEVRWFCRKHHREHIHDGKH